MHSRPVRRICSLGFDETAGPGYVNTIGLHFVLFVVGLPQFGGQTFSFGGIAPLPLAGYGPGMRCEMMTFNEMQQIDSVKEKQDRSEDRTLWHSKKKCQWLQTGCRRANLLLSVAEIRRKPVDDHDLPAQTV